MTWFDLFGGYIIMGVILTALIITIAWYSAKQNKRRQDRLDKIDRLLDRELERMYKED